MIWENKLEVRNDLTDYILRKGETAKFEFSGDGLDSNSHHRLYFTCEYIINVHFFKDGTETVKTVDCSKNSSGKIIL